MASNGPPPPASTNRLSTTSNKSEASSAAPTELAVVVDELLNSLSNKFAGVSSEIFAKMDEMSRRLDNLEATLQSNAQGREEGGGSPTT